MSIQAVLAALQTETQLTATERLILIVVANYADQANSCYPSIRLIAKNCGLTDRTVSSALSALEARGIIRRQKRQRQDGGRTSDRITLTFFAAPEIAPGSEARGGRPVKSTAKPPETISPQEPVTNLSDEPSRERAGALFEDLDPLQPETVPLPPGPTFEDFWRAYPSKVGKGAAAKVWLKALAKVTSVEILRAVEAQKTTDRWLKGYVPNPATWLNQERWADEVTGQAPGLGGLPDW